MTASLDPYPKVPAELKVLRNWVVWRFIDRNGRKTKVPFSPVTNNAASSTDPSTWEAYELAVSASQQYEGIGCMIGPPYVGIDLDKCRDAGTGALEPWAWELTKDLDSYTELSPTGSGVHIWVRGQLPEGGRRCGRVEMYDRARYFTVTGDHLEGTPLAIQGRDLSSLHSRLKTIDPLQKMPPKPVPISTRRSSKFDALMAGSWQEEYTSQSEADLALCSMLARKFGPDASVIDAEFRKSGLYREKWDREDYGPHTIEKAIAGNTCQESGQQQYELKQTRAGSGNSPPVTEAIDWRPTFKSYSQMESGDVQFLISGVLPTGVTFIGGLPGAGKTWFGLSMSKAVVTGQPFLGHYAVPTPMPVLYLIPEVDERAFRSRLESMQLTTAGDMFLCRTLRDGFYPLQQPELLSAVEALEPLVVLDTAIRFSTAENENSATDNKKLTDAIFGLVQHGARGVLGLHHAIKSSANQTSLTLETALRGTGDLAAICDAVWGLQCIDTTSLHVSVQCLKARDFEIPPAFEIMGRPYIGEKGDFVLVDTQLKERTDEQARTFDEFVRERPRANYQQIAERLKVPKKRVRSIAEGAGWQKGPRMERWERIQQSELPF